MESLNTCWQLAIATFSVSSFLVVSIDFPKVYLTQKIECQCSLLRLLLFIFFLIPGALSEFFPASAAFAFLRLMSTYASGELQELCQALPTGHRPKVGDFVVVFHGTKAKNCPKFPHAHLFVFNCADLCPGFFVLLLASFEAWLTID